MEYEMDFAWQESVATVVRLRKEWERFLSLPRTRGFLFGTNKKAFLSRHGTYPDEKHVPAAAASKVKQPTHQANGTYVGSRQPPAFARPPSAGAL